jgi:AcrR family transcriptional regulator
MTKDDVINAAFEVWGRELYKTTSLTKLAETLGVSKPALYRHFPDKQALQKAMEERFYDDYSRAIKPAIEEAHGKGSWQEGLLTIVQFISGYFARHFDYLIFSIIGLHDNKEKHFFNTDALKTRGVSFDKLAFRQSRQFPSALLLAGITGFFTTGAFHKQRLGIVGKASPMELLGQPKFFDKPPDREINNYVRKTAELVQKGLRLNRALIEHLAFEKLESSGKDILLPPDPLLKAVAEAVAEEGPWNASMETVAKRSGLSKSGLYAHFKSKEDMLSRLFMSEFDRIAQCTASRTALGVKREEKLYLAILSIADYLRARPEILTVLDWVRIQQLELDLSTPEILYNFFSDLMIDASLDEFWEKTSHWVLFLLVAVLKHYAVMGKAGKTEEFDYTCLRRLFRFICLGIEGLE